MFHPSPCILFSLHLLPWRATRLREHDEEASGQFHLSVCPQEVGELYTGACETRLGSMENTVVIQSKAMIRLLGIIAEEEVIFITHLAEKARLSHKSVTENVDKLVEYCLVTEKQQGGLRLLQPNFQRIQMVFTRGEGLKTFLE